MRILNLSICFCFLVATSAFAQTVRQASLTAKSKNCSVANSCLVVYVSRGYNAGALLTLQGHFKATLRFEATRDGEVWVALPAMPERGGPSTSSARAQGSWGATNHGGYVAVRIRCSSFTNGPVNARIQTLSAGSGWNEGRSSSPSPD